MSRLKSIVLSLSLVCLCPTILWAQDYFYTSSSTVEALNYNIQSIRPLISPSKVPGGSPEMYLTPQSCLGSFGPIGCYGPLGDLGPLGKNIWNVSKYWQLPVGDWSEWSKKLTDLDGPLSEEGPLGPKGPVSDIYYTGELFQVNDFAVQLRAGGLWGVLGMTGPLGALGPLGPLGPVGAHGYESDSEGNYTSKGKVYRTVAVKYNDSFRNYQLYESYREDYAKKMTGNDTSFMVEGLISPSSEEDSFSFSSDQEQFITLLLVPEKQLDDFDLVLLDQNDRVIADSRSALFIDWIQVKVPADTQLKARVYLDASYHFLSKTYRLYVTGGTHYLNKATITGDHQWPLYQPAPQPLLGKAKPHSVVIYESFQEGVSHWQKSGNSAWQTTFDKQGRAYISPQQLQKGGTWQLTSPSFELPETPTLQMNIVQEWYNEQPQGCQVKISLVDDKGQVTPVWQGENAPSQLSLPLASLNLESKRSYQIRIEFTASGIVASQIPWRLYWIAIEE